MKRLTRFLRRCFGPTATHVTVRAEIPLYWRICAALFLVLLGYSVSYWRYAGGNAAVLRDEVSRLEQENRQLHTQAIHVERQQQINTVAQSDLTKDLTALQEENVRLKEDVGFYRSILEDNAGGVAVIKLHSFRVTPGAHPGEYQYRLLLVQSGKHDKNVQGSLQLTLVGTKDGKAMTQQVMGDRSQQHSGKVNFKYYQPIEGSFTLPAQFVPQNIEAKFFQAGSNEPKLTQTVELTN